MRLQELYLDSARLLEGAGIECGRLEAELLIEYCFDLSRTQLFLQAEDEISLIECSRFNTLLSRRLKREPLHYITGIREFWSLDFIVSPATLIPRPETEFLITHVLATLHNSDFKPRHILDMCSGSGVIAVVLAKELGIPLVGVDISFAALKVAALNVVRHGLQDLVSLFCSDLFSAMIPGVGFDCIVANPPYVPICDRCSLQPEVKDWEPEQALFAGIDGLDIIKNISSQAPLFLRKGGWLFLEIGADQQKSVEEIFSRQVTSTGCGYKHVAVLPDLAGRPRILQAQFVG
ncbi:MAG: peptide chain release factor N(5)-glutamine methyltransferase [Desulfobulbaceae bacterium]|nr:peptide chain release factor N(5)-glutamine methyltransferase [Desulfobulbaceae bacterium]